ncbi:TcpE family conjugal transfer membrane protein [Marinactinospora thermotolerans]|uniref:TcpE family conjugal transfer membrane protein n=1 Tax=Marinactinospora thermotolerans TaxID=531310 RepID=UPI003D93F658
MDLPTYTNIWRIEKRLYKLYDFRLPRPLPLVTFGVWLGVSIVWAFLMSVLRVPFQTPWHVLWLVPPLVIAFFATRPVIEGKRLTELLLSQARFLAEARVYTRLAPQYEPTEVTVAVRVWHRHPDAGPLPAVGGRAARGRGRARGPVEEREVEERETTATDLAVPTAEDHAEVVLHPAVETGPRNAPRSSSRPATDEEREGSADRAAAPSDRRSLGRKVLNYFGFALPRPQAEDTEAVPTASPAVPAAERTELATTRHRDDAPDPFGGDGRETRAREVAPPPRPGTSEELREAEEERENDAWFTALRTPSGETPWPLSSKVAYTTGDTAPMRVPDPDPERLIARRRAEEIMAAPDPSVSDRESAMAVHETARADEGTETPRVPEANGYSRPADISTPKERAEARRGAEAPGREPAPEGDPWHGAEARRRLRGRVQSAAVTRRLDRERSTVEPAPPPSVARGLGDPAGPEEAREQERVGRPRPRPHAAPWDLPPAGSGTEGDERHGTAPREQGPDDEKADDRPTTGPDVPQEAAPAPDTTAATVSATSRTEEDAEASATTWPRIDVVHYRRAPKPTADTTASATAPTASAEEPVRTGYDAGEHADAHDPVEGRAVDKAEEEHAPEPAESTGQDREAGRAETDEESLSERAATPRDDTPVTDDTPKTEETPQPSTPRAADDTAREPAVAPLLLPVKPVLELDHGTGEHESLSDITDPRPRRTLEQLEAAERAAFQARDRRDTGGPEAREEAATPDDHGEPRRSGRLSRTVRSAGTGPQPAAGQEEDAPTGDERGDRTGGGVFSRVTDNARRLSRLFTPPNGVPTPNGPQERPSSAAGNKKPELQLDHSTGEQEALPGAAAPDDDPVGRRTGAGWPARGRTERSAPSDTPDSGTRGWRRLARVVTGGNAVQSRTDLPAADLERLRAPFEGSRRIVVLGCTGGAGQTVTTLMLGHTLAEHRDRPVVAVDVNPGGTGLSRRIRTETPETLTSLLANTGGVQGYLGMRQYTSQSSTGLEVVTTLDDPYVQTLDDRDYAGLTGLLERFYEITLLDPAATGVARALPIVDALVLVAPASADAARAVAMTFEWLDGHGYADLRAKAIVVINGVSRRSLADVDAAEQVARGRCRAIVRVPWDDHLAAARGVVDVTTLRATTRRAHAALAGVIVTGFTGGHGGAGGSRVASEAQR